MKREVYLTQNMSDYTRACDNLSAQGIKYSTKVRSQNSQSFSLFSSRRSTLGTAFENSNLQNMYYIYVNRKDYKQACSVLGVNKPF
ncbi:hypothetical protein AOC36_10600 [Erysipelothrix larvae]|uniref:DUF2007 domain-containing protein n=1 Tax=Erysipelothrix larvae TaxID=1514105 RepID=A0A0X8H1I8_9FIRM|nr:hypothetical protein [Erysipelothrix larvae]AMC94404.1 hypothetical protein AOC36_10600 [Erysipelothrix larvae]